MYEAETAPVFVGLRWLVRFDRGRERRGEERIRAQSAIVLVHVDTHTHIHIDIQIHSCLWAP